MLPVELESPGKRARRKRREALQRRDDCLKFAMQRKSAFWQNFWERIADSQQDEADRQLMRCR